MESLAASNLKKRIHAQKCHPQIGCPLFYIKYINRNVGPIAGIHFSTVTKLPITHFCPHRRISTNKEYFCSPVHEYFYFLILTFARGDITLSQFKTLLPIDKYVPTAITSVSRGNVVRGIVNHKPKYSTTDFENCTGFKCIEYTAYVGCPANHGQKMIYAGRDWDHSNLNPYTEGCSHISCQHEARGLFAVIKGYAAMLFDGEDFSQEPGPGNILLCNTLHRYFMREKKIPI